ncbi:MAG: polysaccharide pyruvyl transferase family protein, partial [Candidatus Omnitrophica bacterium]|nr:polysaccharide pyruvyl transferase family protein [Candidatus Omnitrophota bacterium]
MRLGKFFTLPRVILENRRFFVPFVRRVGYIGWLGHGNLGDEAVYLAFRKLFANFTVLPFKSDRDITAFEDRFGQRVFDAVFLGGGTLINTEFVENLRVAQKRYGPTFVFATGVIWPSLWGSVERRPTFILKKEETAACLNKCGYVGVRGPLSRKILAEEGGFQGAQIIGDLILSLSSGAAEHRDRKMTLGMNIGLTNGHMWGTEEGVLDFIVRFAKIMIDKRWRVMFFPVMDRDVGYIEEAARRINSHVSIFHGYRSIGKTLNALEGCDIFIGEKLHSTAAAICVNTPSIMLEYQPKCLDFMMSMELEKFNIRTDKLALDTAVNLTEELVANLSFYRDKIAAKAAYYKRLQEEKAGLISDMIRQPRGKRRRQSKGALTHQKGDLERIWG